MPSGEKSKYVSAARMIKEEFVAAHPDAKSRGIRKNKRKSVDGTGRAPKNVVPPSLHALALVGSRLNQQPEETPPPLQPSLYCQQPPSLLDQLCTVAENEHTAAAHMLSALSAF